MLEVFLTMGYWCFAIRINRIRRGDASRLLPDRFQYFNWPKFPFFESWIFRISRIRRGDACIVFSPTGSNVKIVLNALFLNH